MLQRPPEKILKGLLCGLSHYAAITGVKGGGRDK